MCAMFVQTVHVLDGYSYVELVKSVLALPLTVSPCGSTMEEERGSVEGGREGSRREREGWGKGEGRGKGRGERG